MRLSGRAFFSRGGALIAASQLPFVLTRTRRVRASGAALSRDPDGILDLPAGFRYVLLQSAGETMSDGFSVGGLPDGMACFWDRAREHYLLMRNHECEFGPSVDRALAFNPDRSGGVSRLVIEPGSLDVVSSNWVLTGTSRNCAGGPSPWGWLSCEEAEELGHGYVFVCDPEARRLQPPQPEPSLGRFRHEAAAVDPKSHVIYLTEDKSDGAFYRHVPRDRSRPFDGTLEALRVRGRDRFDTSGGMQLGDRLEVDWVPVDDPEGAQLRTAHQAFERGAARVNRGEGMWWGDGSVFFTATAGGPQGVGQVFRLDPTRDGGVLSLVAQEEGDGAFINPDNITVAPWGDLIVVEDNLGPNHILGITPEGEVYPLARNRYRHGSSEFCGVCFSPDGRVMFVNLQVPGYTLAVIGPFDQIAYAGYTLGGGGGC